MMPRSLWRDSGFASHHGFSLFQPEGQPSTGFQTGPQPSQVNSLDLDLGMLYLLERRIPWYAAIQTSWIGNDSLLIRYEDLLTDEHAVFEGIIDYCEIDVDRQGLHDIVADNSFEAVTGRQRGEEDVNAHQRKGIAGDWRNHLSDPVKEEFKTRFGQVLINTGYEKGLNW